MRNSREAIYTTLATSLQDYLPTINPQLLSVSRVMRPISDYGSAQLPAAVLDETSEEVNADNEGPLPLYKLHVDLWLLLPAPQLSQTPGAETIVPMTALNTLIDALENGGPISNPPANGMTYNTLGGIVQWVRIEGKILKVAGVGSGNTPVSIARVPLIIFTT